MIFKELNIKTVVEELQEAHNSSNQSFEAFRYNEIKYVLLSHLHTSKT